MLNLAPHLLCALLVQRVAAIGVQDLGIFVVTAPGDKYAERVRLARRTWASPRDLPVIFVAGQTGSLPDPILQLNCSDAHLWGMCCKTIAGLRLALKRFPSANWLVRVVDDTFVFAEHLATELGMFSSAGLVYLGAAIVSLLCHFSLHAGACSEAHAGGSGVVLSRPLAELLLQHADVFLEACVQDDLHLGHFLRHALDVHVVSLPGFVQEPRITSLAPLEDVPHTTLQVPPRCPFPLPRPVYARIDDWGPVHPFAPIDARRLLLLHSDPRLWTSLQEMSEVVQQMPSDQGVLAYFAGADGRRVVGPRYESRGALGLCIYRGHAERLDSFRSHLVRVQHEEEAEGVPLLASLHWAAHRGHLALVKDLLAARTNVNEQRQRAPVQEELSALHFAALQGHAEVAEELLKYRADMSVRATLSGLTPLDIAKFAHVHGYAKSTAVVDKLQKIGAEEYAGADEMFAM